MGRRPGATLAESEIVFVVHVTDSENAALIRAALDRPSQRRRAVIVINCLGDLMRCTRMGKLRFPLRGNERTPGPARRLVRKLATWVASHARARRSPSRT